MREWVPGLGSKSILYHLRIKKDQYINGSSKNYCNSIENDCNLSMGYDAPKNYLVVTLTQNGVFVISNGALYEC